MIENILLTLLALSRMSTLVSSSNMNGKYIVTSGNHVGVTFNDNYESKGHEYFDVYSPVRNLKDDACLYIQNSHNINRNWRHITVKFFG